MCVSIDTSVSISTPNINATSLSVKSSIEKEKKKKGRRPNSREKNHLLRHLNLLNFNIR
jgi:hypothetical protein